MYFWNINKLEKDLKKGISQKEDMKYLFAIMLIISLASFWYSSSNWYDFLISLFLLIFTAFEILLLFKINKSNKWKNFLSRYFAIWFVIFIRSLIIILLPLILLFFIILITYWIKLDGSSIFDLVLIIIYSIAYLFLQINSFKKINS